MKSVYTVRRKNGGDNLTTLEQHFNYILNRYNFDLYNVNDSFHIQLFDKEYFANDEMDCEAEFDGNTIASVVIQAIKWIDEQNEI